MCINLIGRKIRCIDTDNYHYKLGETTRLVDGDSETNTYETSRGLIVKNYSGVFRHLSSKTTFDLMSER